MLHIILGILKVIGIILGIIIGILLVLCIVILFVPVRYRGKFHKDEKDLWAKGNVTWLAHILSISVVYQDQDFSYKIRFLGISLEHFQKLVQLLQRRKKRIEKEKLKHTEVPQLEATSIKDPADGQSNGNLQDETKGRSVTSALLEPSGEDAEEVIKKVSKWNRFWNIIKESVIKIVNIFKWILGLPQRICRIYRKISLTIRNIYGKIKELLKLLQSKEFAGAKAVIWEQILILLKHAGPRKWKGTLSFGFDDPALTGQVLAGLGMCYPIYKGHVDISPYFDRKILEGDFYLRGRMYGFMMLRIIWKLYFNPNIKFMMKRFQH